MEDRKEEEGGMKEEVGGTLSLINGGRSALCSNLTMQIRDEAQFKGRK